MRPLVVRPAAEADLAGIEHLINTFVVGHPAAAHPRSRAALRMAYLGPGRVAELLVAERSGTLVGMRQWRRIHDLFWGMFGAEGEWLFVMPGLRGLGVGAAIVAAICARARSAGCEYLHGHAGAADIARLYARAAIESPGWSFFLSAAAFHDFAALDGLPPREIVRRMPDPARNRVAPARP